MKLSLLNDLTCPHHSNGFTCSGEFFVGDPLPPLFARDDPDELLEGVLVCARCGKEYPVLCGVLILLNRVDSYLRERFSYIASAAALHGATQAALSYMSERGHDLYTRPHSRSDYDSPRWIDMFLCLHYDRMDNLCPDGHPLRDLVVRHGNSFWNTIMSGIESEVARGATALDVGCNVGGTLMRLSSRCQRVLGVDVSFTAVLTARQVLLGRPQPLSSYRLFREGDLFESRPLSVSRPNNVEAIVASGMELPFRMHFDLITSLNLLDVVPDPPSLVESACLALTDGGTLILSSPYTWIADDAPVDRWLGGRSGTLSSEAVRARLGQLGLQITREANNVPWIWREYDRWFRVYLVDCIFAHKKEHIH